MAKRERNKKSAEEYSLLSICIKEYNAAVDASINYKVKEPKRCHGMASPQLMCR